MDGMKLIFDGCFSIMQLPINLFGFQVTLWTLFLFCSLGCCLVRFFYGLFE